MRRQRIVSIELKDLTVKFPGQSANLLDNISIDFPIGKNIGIEGPAGTGKSILLRIMAGLTEPSSGSVYYNGVSLGNMTFEEYNPLRLSTSFCFENGGLLTNKSILDNLKLSLIYHNQWRAERSEQLLNELVTHFGIEKYLNLRPSAVSVGIRKIAGLVRTFLSNAQVMFFDEPSAGLGESGIKAIADWIVKWQKEKKKDESLVFTSSDRHFLDEIDCKRFYINDGCIIPSRRQFKGAS